MKNLDKTCENCKKVYNQKFFECPYCRNKNDEGDKKSLENPFLYLDFNKSILILLIGLVLLYILQFLIQFVTQMILLQNSYSLEEIQQFILNGNYQFSVTLIIYLLIIGSFVYIVYPYLKYLKLFYKKWQKILCSILLMIISITLTYLYSFLIENYTFVKDSMNQNQTVIISAIKDNIALAFFSTVIFGPIAEEIIFRVGLFNTINKFNKIAAYIIATFIFAFLHISFSGDLAVEFIYLPSYLILSATLVFIYDKFGFENAVICHTLNNLISFIGVLISIYG